MNLRKSVELLIAGCLLLALQIGPAFSDPPSEETPGENASTDVFLTEALRDLVRREATLAEARGEESAFAPILVEGLEEPTRPRALSPDESPLSLYRLSHSQFEDSIPPMTDGGAFTIERNPNAQRVNADFEQMDPEAALESIVSSADRMVLRQDRSGVRNIIRADMVTATRWPLNWPLGSIAQQELTLAEAMSHLDNQFNMDVFPNQQSVISGHESEVAWRPNGEDATARDLVNAIIGHIATPGEYYKIQISTLPNPPDEDTADISTWPASTEIRWHLVAVNW